MDKSVAIEFEKLNTRVAELEKRLVAAEEQAKNAEQLAQESLRLVERASSLLVEHIATFDTRVAEASDIIVARVTKQIPHLML
jgi:hypothetical protein